MNTDMLIRTLVINATSNINFMMLSRHEKSVCQVIRAVSVNMLSRGLEKSLKIKKIGEVCEKTSNVPQESFLQSEIVSYSVLLEDTCLH